MKNLPFYNKQPPSPQREWSSEEGARVLAEKIKDYWRNLGINIDIQPVNLGNTPTGHGSVWGLRSNMVNGIPSDKEKRECIVQAAIEWFMAHERHRRSPLNQDFANALRDREQTLSEAIFKMREKNDKGK